MPKRANSCMQETDGTTHLFDLSHSKHAWQRAELCECPGGKRAACRRQTEQHSCSFHCTASKLGRGQKCVDAQEGKQLCMQDTDDAHNSCMQGIVDRSKSLFHLGSCKRVFRILKGVPSHQDRKKVETPCLYQIHSHANHRGSFNTSVRFKLKLRS